MTTDDGFEPVYVEDHWYDGPRSGLAAVQGVTHYFHALHDYNWHDDEDDVYLVWPTDERVLAEEREQWAIFVEWCRQSEAGCASAEGHPGNGGVNPRYDELEDQLTPHRVVPEGARRLRAKWRPHGRHKGYDITGPGYEVRWTSI
jgi:hypothetical protein